MTSSSSGFIGLATVRYFPRNTTLLPLLFEEDISGSQGFDVVNEYMISIGAGASSSTFYYPFINSLLKTTVITLDNVCDVWNGLNFIMGLIDVQVNVYSTVSGTTSSPSFNVRFTYYENNQQVIVEANVPCSQSIISTCVRLPIPVITEKPQCEYPSGNLIKGLGTVLLPCYLVFNTTPFQFVSNLSKTSSATLIPLSAWILADITDLSGNFNFSDYSLVISDINSRFTPFTYSKNNLSNGGCESSSEYCTTGNAAQLGGFTASLQYQSNVVTPQSVPTVIASSVNNTVGSILLDNKNKA